MSSNNTHPSGGVEQEVGTGVNNKNTTPDTTNNESDPTMSTLMATQRAAPPGLTQFFDDLDRFTIWDVGYAAAHIPGIHSTHESEDYSEISAGIAPERLVIKRDDEARLHLVFTVGLDFLPNGEVDEETITGWKWRTDNNQWNTEDADGSLDGLYQLIDQWAGESAKDDLPVLSRVLVGSDGTRFRLYWKPLRFLRSDGSVETTWDTENFPPASWSSNPFEDRVVGGVHFGSEGGAYSSQQVASVNDLTSGTFAVVREDS